MQVRHYPFQIDAPISPALRDTMMLAHFVTRAWRSVSRARDQRVRAARSRETPARSPAGSSAFRSTLDECGIEVVDFDKTMSSLLADPEKATTVKELFGSLAGKRAATPGLGARVQELLMKCGAAPHASASAVSPKPAAASPQPPPKPQPASPAASPRERPRSKDFRWEFTAAACAAEGQAPPEPAPPTQPAATPAEPSRAPERPAATTADASPEQPPGASTTATTGVSADPPAGASVQGAAVPTEVGIVVALEQLSQQAEALGKRLEALEALIASQTRRLEETERKLEAVLRRLEAREEAERAQAQLLARTQQELAELRERVAEVEVKRSEPPTSASEAPPATTSTAASSDTTPVETPPPDLSTESEPAVAPSLTIEDSPPPHTGAPDVAAEAPRAEPPHAPETLVSTDIPVPAADNETRTNAARIVPAEPATTADPHQRLQDTLLQVEEMQRRLLDTEVRSASHETRIQTTATLTEQLENKLGREE